MIFDVRILIVIGYFLFKKQALMGLLKVYGTQKPLHCFIFIMMLLINPLWQSMAKKTYLK